MPRCFGLVCLRLFCCSTHASQLPETFEMEDSDINSKSFDAEIEFEKRKISELYREIKNKDSDEAEKINWMYKNPSESVDREEYLLGRSVDKALDNLSGLVNSSTTTEASNIPKRVLTGENKTIREQVDLQKKIHEDPLFAIREKEIALRKQLLNNPLKVKQLKMMIEAQVNKQKLAEKSKAKVEKKRERAENIDRLLCRQLKKLSKRFDLADIIRNIDNSSESSDSGDLVNKKYIKTRSPFSEKKGQKGAVRKKRKNEEKEEEKDNGSRRKRIYKKNRRQSKRKDSSSSDLSTVFDSDEDLPKKKRMKAKSSEHSDSDKKSHKKKRRTSSSEDFKSNEIKYTKTAKKRIRRRAQSSEVTDSSESDEHKSNKKKRRAISSEASSNDDRKCKKKRKDKAKVAQGSSYSDSDDQGPSKEHTKPKKTKRDRSESRDQNSGDNDRKIIATKVNSRENYKKSKKSENELRRENVDSSMEDKKSHRRKQSRSDSDSEYNERRHKKNYGLSMLDGSKPDLSAKKVASYKKDEPVKAKYVPNKKNKLSEKEMEAELKKMTADAEWRKKEREADYSKYKREKQKEETLKDYDHSFMRSQLSSMTSHGSVADRLKSKLNTIQRAGSSMDKSFVRK